MGNKAGKANTRHQRGATLVEFAIIAPLLFLLIFAVIEFGRVITTYTGVYTAAREGARYAIAVGEEGSRPFLDCDGIRDAARDKAVLADIETIEIHYHAVGSELDNTPIADCQGITPPTETLVQTKTRIQVTAKTTFDSPIPIVSIFLDDIDIGSTQARTIYYGTVGS